MVLSGFATTNKKANLYNGIRHQEYNYWKQIIPAAAFQKLNYNHCFSRSHTKKRRVKPPFFVFYVKQSCDSLYPIVNNKNN
jgi:hypothetical protein